MPGDPSALAPYLFSLMQRNISTAGYVIADHNAVPPPQPGRFSSPGCILASPSWCVGQSNANPSGFSYPGNVAQIGFDYAFNWARDAAITMGEVLNQSPAQIPADAATQLLANYVRFASTCQQSDTTKNGQAKYTPEGGSTGALDEGDGPALRVLTILQGYASLDSSTQAIAEQVIQTDLQYLFFNDLYMNPTGTLWEDEIGQSIFARAVQLKCMQQMANNPFGITPPGNASAAATWLAAQLTAHWSGAPNNWYIGVLGASRLNGDPPVAYDPSMDPVLACLYGAGLSCADPQLLSTAAQVRAQWTQGGANPFPINLADAKAGIGPLFGRYAGDEYDGLVLNSGTGHPWAVCSCCFAWLYYQLANTITGGAAVPTDPLASSFFAQINVPDVAAVTKAQVVSALQDAGDSILNAVIYHSNHLELSEQFDASSGYERSVSNLTWSYAAFLAAVRARNLVTP